VQRALKNIFVKPLATITIPPIGPFCQQDPAVQISASPRGGTWTSPNNSVSISATDTLFTPNVAGQNLIGHTLTYSFTNNFKCTTSKTTSVIVQPLPTVSAGQDLGICQNTTPFQLTGFSPTSGGTMTWIMLNTSFNTINNSAQYQPDSVSVDTLIYNFRLPSGCNKSDTMVVTVLKPVDADAGLIDSICVSNGTYTLQSGAATPFNPSFGSQWTGLGITAGTNAINISSFTTADLNKDQQYIYRYGTGNCETFDTTFIKVFALPTITPPTVPNNALCQDADVLEIIGYKGLTNGVTAFDSTFGVWSGSGISKVGNKFFFDPELAGASSAPVTLTYTYTDANTRNCQNVYNHQVSVEALPVADFDIPSIYCVDAELVINNLSSIPFGTLDSSFWSFSPTDSLKEKFVNSSKFTYDSSGFYTIQYTVVSAKGCDSTISKNIQIIDPPKAKFTLNTNPVSNCGPVTALIQDQSTGFDSTYYWNFGLDNVLRQTYLPNDTSLVYNQGSITDTIYKVTLVVQNQCASDTLVDSVRVLPTPIASFGTDKSVGCSVAEFEFNNNSRGYIDGQNTFYTFTFSDGSPTFGPVTHRVINNKRFELAPPKRGFVYNGYNDTTNTIRLVAVNTCGSDTAYHSVKVLPNDVKAFFNQSINEGCSPLVVNYTDFSTNADFVAYDFGDNSSQATRNASHKFTNNTNQIVTYNVSQFVNNVCSKDTMTQSIRVFPIPNADFQIRATATCEKDSILFVNKSTGYNNSQWIFQTVRDTIRNLKNDVWYQFDTSGTQTIKLVVSESQHNCTDTTIKTIDINKVPRSVFDNDTIAACEPYLFTQSLTFENPDDQFFWINHQADTVSRFKDIEYNYPQDGEYTMILVTKAKSGCTNVDSILVDVAPSPEVGFNVTKPDDLCVFPKTYGFKSSSSLDVQIFKWYLDGVLIDSLDTTSTTFTTPDTVEISLFAQNNFNCFDSKTKEIIIAPLPIANFNTPNRLGCEPYFVSFENFSQNASAYDWKFGDEFSSQAEAPNHLYTDGLYSIRLIASNIEGCQDTLTRTSYVNVLNKPEADFEYLADANPQNYGLMHFTSTSKFATFYTWDFGNTTEDTDSNRISHVFDFYGKQSVQMIATNENNCTDTVSKIIQVPFFGGLFVPNAFIPSSSNPEICVFKPVGFGLKTYTCQVFDTWGNLIWESDKIENGAPAEGWNGKHNGEPLPENAYVWKIEATFIDGYNWEGMQYEGESRKRKVGTITLVR
jgi:PKD repeat protein